MARKNFTESRIKTFTSGGKEQKFLWDLNTRGLGLRATRNGAKAFIFQGKLAGNDIRITIGKPDSWSIEEARIEARSLQVEVDKNIDPRQEKRKKQQAIKVKRLNQKRKIITVAKAWDSYIDYKREDWSENSLKDHLKMMKPGGEPYKHYTQKPPKITKPGILSSLGKLRLNELTAEVVINWIKKEKILRPTQTALAFRLLRAFVNWCLENEKYSPLVYSEAVNSKKVKGYIPKNKVKQDVLEKNQLEPWFNEVTKLNPVISTFLQTVLITGARKEEILSLKWQDVDFKWSKIKLSDKVDSTREIPLTPYVEQLLSHLPRVNEWVFSSKRSNSGRLINATKAHNQAVKKAGIENLTIHDLRRTFTTLANWVSLPIGIVNQISGHKPSATVEKHYDVKPVSILAYWHSGYEAWMLKQANIEAPKSSNGYETPILSEISLTLQNIESQNK